MVLEQKTAAAKRIYDYELYAVDVKTFKVNRSGKELSHALVALFSVVCRTKRSSLFFLEAIVHENGTDVIYNTIETSISCVETLCPTVNVSTQRLSDQVRAIQRLRLLDQSLLDRLRYEALPVPIEPQENQVVTDTVAPIIQHDEEIQVQVCASNQDYERLSSALEDSIQEYRLVSSCSRPRLPRLPMHRRNVSLVGALDSILKPYLESSTDLIDTHSLLYCGAVAVCRVAEVKSPNLTQTAYRPPTKPQWQCRIEKRIDRARILIAKLMCFQKGNTRPRVMCFVDQAFAGTGISSNEYMTCIIERIDFWKQKVYAWASRIRRYRLRSERYHLNRVFQRDQRSVYRNWELSQSQVTNEPYNVNEEDMSTFWKNIWSIPIGHSEGEWIQTVRRECESYKEMDPITISAIDVSRAVRSMPNWKSPGPDGLHSYWIKWIRSSHERLAAQFQQALEMGSLPDFMTSGITYLIYKSGNTSDPKNYRPITCLPTIYKLLTSILRIKIQNHIFNNNILSPNQNGCKAGSRGTKDLLLIDMTITQQVRRGKRNVHMAWIDYKKAYDSVPHTWLMRVLELYKINPILCSFLSSCMGQWSTFLSQPGQMTSSAAPNLIRIKRGIFQGDSLSPLWFCLALNPLSTLLKDSTLGYRLRRGAEAISHLLFMDDLKLFASKKPDLMSLLKITDSFSKAIGMEFGVDKCAFIDVQRVFSYNACSLDVRGCIFKAWLEYTELKAKVNYSMDTSAPELKSRSNKVKI
uniref:Reverse transcriptase domain-containing protein n=1 Tax=Bombyx mori TaxID=7091 RepID=A0A8R2M4H1_BOMMO|nr:uncharacterized protein LOC119629884 [Bombyx mori]